MVPEGISPQLIFIEEEPKQVKDCQMTQLELKDITKMSYSNT